MKTKPSSALAGNPDAAALARCGVLYENAGFYVTKAVKGFEVYAPSASGTHAERCAIVGYEGETGLTRAKVEADKRAARKPPSLGSNGLAIWRKWRALTEMGWESSRIEAIHVGVGVFQWREGKLWRLTRVNRLPLCHEITSAESDSLFDDLCKGYVQIYLPACRGLYGEKVLHQATGASVPQNEA